MLSIFDIPLIINAICDSLEPSDIWRCYQVNKTWCRLFGPHRYRTIRFSYLDSDQTWHILNNAHRIRRLRIDLADAGYFIDAPCTRLRELICVDMGYMYDENDDDDDDDETWQELEPSANALSLIGKNPYLSTLVVNYQPSVIWPMPFSMEVFSSISSHQSLTKISLEMAMDLRTLKLFIMHLPKPLQDLELRIFLDRPYEDDPEVPPFVRFTQPTQLRSLLFRPSAAHANTILVPLLQHCPHLEHLKLRQVDRTTFEDKVAPALVKHCPNIRSLHHNFWNRDWLHGMTNLLDQYPRGIQSLILHQNAVHAHPTTPPEYTGALIRVLLKHSANTLQVLRLTGYMGQWIVGSSSIMEQCPNLRELAITGLHSLDDLIQQPRQGASPSWRTNPFWSRDTPQQVPVLPWVCTKLQSITLHFRKPHDRRLGLLIQDEQETMESDITVDELDTKTVLQVGILLSTLKTLKSLKVKSITWGEDVLGVTERVSLERAIFYMNQAGLTGITPGDITALGLCWDTVLDRQRAEDEKKLIQVAINERTGLDGHLNVGRLNSGYWEAEDKEMDWPFNVDQKKFHKCGTVYSRRSARSNAEWFGRRPK
ncbi:hypothetical protein BGX31_001978 [Mortierella sp. GBA43]|nr:hypothetical protein BGX31_001978 [Mortierella sp. GBA43]